MHMNNTPYRLVVLSMFLVGALITVANSGTYEISEFTTASGLRSVSGSGKYELHGIVGQAEAGSLSGGGFSLAGGFVYEDMSSGDTDGDGLPDAWEQQIVDADPGDDILSVGDVLPSDDFDGDGMSNADEYYAGTDPTDSDSVFELTQTYMLDQEHLELRWMAVDGKTYRVLFCTNLVAGSWTPVASNIPGFDGEMAYTSLVERAEGFLRIEVE